MQNIMQLINIYLKKLKLKSQHLLFKKEKQF